MLHADLISAVRTAVEIAISPLQVVNLSVVEGKDYDTNDVLFITIDLPSGTGPIPTAYYMRVLNTVSETLLRSGDERTPLLRTIREGDVDTTEDEMALKP